MCETEQREGEGQRHTRKNERQKEKRECGGGGGVTERLCENEGGEGERYRE